MGTVYTLRTFYSLDEFERETNELYATGAHLHSWQNIAKPIDLRGHAIGDVTDVIIIAMYKR